MPPPASLIAINGAFGTTVCAAAGFNFRRFRENWPPPDSFFVKTGCAPAKPGPVWVKSVANRVKSVADLTQIATELTQTAADLTRSAADLIPMFTDLTRSAIDLTQIVTDLIPTMTD